MKTGVEVTIDTSVKVSIGTDAKVTVVTGAKVMVTVDTGFKVTGILTLGNLVGELRTVTGRLLVG